MNIGSEVASTASHTGAPRLRPRVRGVGAGVAGTGEATVREEVMGILEGIE
jgi:hypothetical protein